VGEVPAVRSVETILFLVVLGTVVAAFAGRLQIPARSLLVVAGLLIGLLPGVPAVRVAPEVVSLVVLPPLLYAASEELPWRDLRAVWRPVVVLAVGLVLFQIAVSVAVAGTAGTTAGAMVLHGAGQFVVLAAGGAAAGGVVAAGVIAVRWRVTDPVLDTVLALVTPYAAYVLGATLHVSPVMAVIIAGLVIGTRWSRITTAQTQLQLDSVYQTVIFLLESVVFSLIGLQLPSLIRALSHAEAWPLEALAVAGTLIATRIFWVFPLSAVLQRRSGSRSLSWPVPAVVSWAGTRGVVPLAAALSIPLASASGHLCRGVTSSWCSPPRSSWSRSSCKGSPWSRWPGSPGSPGPPTPAARKPWPGSAWPKPPWPGSMNSRAMTPFPTP
jgi:CPA1 family monovalent cation:H+ antiporter